LALRGLQRPTRAGVQIEGVTVDLAFDNARAVVLFEDDHSRDVTPLVFSGWHVVRVASTEPLEAAITSNPTVFGRTV